MAGLGTLQYIIKASAPLSPQVTNVDLVKNNAAGTGQGHMPTQPWTSHPPATGSMGHDPHGLEQQQSSFSLIA